MSLRRGIQLVLSGLVIAMNLQSCRSAPTRIYTLYAVAPISAPLPYNGPRVRIDGVHVPAAYDRIQIVSEVATGELELNDREHWGAPLAEVARAALSADLASRLPAGSFIYPHFAKTDDAIGIRVEVLDIQITHQGAALRSSWSVNARKSQSVGFGEATVSRPDLKSSDAHPSQAMSELLGLLADRIVADVRSRFGDEGGGPAHN